MPPEILQRPDAGGDEVRQSPSPQYLTNRFTFTTNARGGTVSNTSAHPQSTEVPCQWQMPHAGGRGRFRTMLVIFALPQVPALSA